PGDDLAEQIGDLGAAAIAAGYDDAAVPEALLAIDRVEPAVLVTRTGRPVVRATAALTPPTEEGQPRQLGLGVVDGVGQHDDLRVDPAGGTARVVAPEALAAVAAEVQRGTEVAGVRTRRPGDRRAWPGP